MQHHAAPRRAPRSDNADPWAMNDRLVSVACFPAWPVAVPIPTDGAHRPVRPWSAEGSRAIRPAGKTELGQV